MRNKNLGSQGCMYLGVTVLDTWSNLMSLYSLCIFAPALYLPSLWCKLQPLLGSCCRCYLVLFRKDKFEKEHIRRFKKVVEAPVWWWGQGSSIWLVVRQSKLLPPFSAAQNMKATGSWSGEFSQLESFASES